MAARYEYLGDGIYCIDTDLYRPGLAACYLVTEGDAAAFVDTGTYHTVPRLLEVLEAAGLTADNVRYVMPTHVHLDHGGGAGELMARCPKATLVVHPKGAPHVMDPSRLQAGAMAVYGEEGFRRDYGKLVPVAAERIVMAQDGQTFDLNGRGLTFYDTPGHANHHGCILDQRTRACFTGDTFGISYREFDTAKGAWLFAPTTPVAFSPQEWHDSVEKLMALNPSAMLLTHYGRVTELPRLAEALHTSIDQLARLAHTGMEPAEGRVERLREQIFNTWLEEIDTHGSILPERDSRKLLEVDATLNAQGLDVWLKRLAQGKTSLGFR